MKSLSLCLAAVCCLCGCAAHPAALSAQQVEAALVQPMEADLCLQTDLLEVRGHWERAGAEVYSFEVTAPQELAGLRLGVEQQSCRLSFGDMELELGTDALPTGFGLALLGGALDGLPRREESTLEATPEGGAELRGRVAGAEYCLRLDANCRPLSFAVPKHNVTILWEAETAS